MLKRIALVIGCLSLTAAGCGMIARAYVVTGTAPEVQAETWTISEQEEAHYKAAEDAEAEAGKIHALMEENGSEGKIRALTVICGK